MAQKRKFTQEELDYITNNYRTTKNEELGKFLGIPTKCVYRVLVNIGLKRTKEEVKFLVESRSNIGSNGSESRRNIEGGSRDNFKAMWHKTVWTKKNGKIPDGMIIVYATPNYDSAEDLVLIEKKKFNSFIRKRNSEIKKRAKEEQKREKKLQQEKKKAEDIQKEIRRIKKEREDEKAEAFRASIRKKVNSHHHNSEEGKVPVRIDSRTIVYVKKEKCEALPDGSYILKKGEKTKVKSVDAFMDEFLVKPGKKNKKNNDE